MSSASPPKEPEVEQGTQSGDDPEHMEREHQETQTQGPGEFEVKEQDRWLPIANGALACPCISSVDPDLRVSLPLLAIFLSLAGYRLTSVAVTCLKFPTGKGYMLGIFGDLHFIRRLRPS